MVSSDNQQVVKLLIAGDYHLSSNVGDYSPEQTFGGLLPRIQEADLAIANLEAPITNAADTIIKTGPSIRGSFSSLQLLRSSGFGMVTLANNHIMDHGEAGLTDTLKHCDQLGIRHIGAAGSLIEACKAHEETIHGVGLAVLNFTENEFSTTHGPFPGANPLDPVENFRAIRQAKEKADHVIVIVHGGHERYQLPSPRIKATYRFFIEAGASAVLGHHTHCYSGYEVYRGRPVWYSLGNLLFEWKGSKHENWYAGYAVQLTLTRGAVSHELIPYMLEKDREAIRLMNAVETSAFYDRLHTLNEIITDDAKLEAEFVRYCAQVSRSYRYYLEPHSSRLLQALQNRRILPSFVKKKKKQLLLNLIRCESHRDIVLRILSEG